jgi:hypothetical protein
VSTLFDLMDDVPDWVHVAEPESIEQRFWTFHTAHPEVYRELVVLARRARAAGRERLGMKMLFEVVRWNRMEREAGLSGLFATRELRAA